MSYGFSCPFFSHSLIFSPTNLLFLSPKTSLISHLLKICFVTINKILTIDAGEDVRRKAAVFTAGGNVSADILGITVRIPLNPK